MHGNKTQAKPKKVYRGKFVVGSYYEWWYGRHTSSEAEYFVASQKDKFGNFVICCPDDFLKIRPNSPTYLLVVRTFTGPQDIYFLEYTFDVKYNALMKHGGFDRDVEYDPLLKNSKDVFPTVVSYIIRRTKKGMFYIEPGRNFECLDELVEHYYANFLPSRITKLLLTASPLTPTRAPLPPHLYGGNVKFMATTTERIPFLRQKTIDTYIPRFSEIFLKTPEKLKVSSGAARFFMNGRYKKVYVKFIRDRKKISAPAFYRDVLMINNSRVVNSMGRRNLLCPIDCGLAGDFCWIASEFLPGITLYMMLKKYSQAPEVFSQRKIIDMAYQISSGMCYLERCKLYHRSLQSKKIVVTHETNSVIVLRVAGFMLNDHNITTESMQSQYAWQWLAPESLLQQQFDIRSDVWSFACVVAEILSLGSQPHVYTVPPISKLADLKTAFKENKPVLNGFKNVFFTKMIEHCVKYDPKQRPTFHAINTLLKQSLFYDPNL